MRQPDDIDNMFATLAGMVSEENVKSNPVEFAAVTAGLAILRAFLIDVRRIADACDASAAEMKSSQEAYRTALNRHNYQA